MPDEITQYLFVYRAFSHEPGRCHVLVDEARGDVLVGDPVDNPGTSVTNAIEEIADGLERALRRTVADRHLFQYVPWDLHTRAPRIFVVEFKASNHRMPVWEDADRTDPFVADALSVVKAIHPYEVSRMAQLPPLSPPVT